MANEERDIEQFMTTARERFQASHDAEWKFRAKALDDLKFYDGDQWPEEIKRQREADGRPCLTFPVIQQFIRQISNDIRKNKPTGSVAPVGHEDVDTADVIVGIGRKIERQSKADVARSYAALYAIICGRGWYRLTTRYEYDGELDEGMGEEIFDQEIYVERVKNQAGVYPDPTCQKPDYSDMKYCFEVEDWLRAEYKIAYPKSQAAGLEDFTSIGDQAIHWCTADTIRIANYWYVETEDLKVASIVNAAGYVQIVPLKDVPKGTEILKQRTLKRKKVCWAKINGVEILEEKKWPIEWIPLIPVLGEELQIDGETSLSGMVRGIKSAQQQYNYMRTMQTETIALAPRAPYVAEEGQIAGHEDQWQAANVKNFAVLTYKGKSIDGNLVPAPQRQNFEPAIQATTLAVGQAYEDLKRGSGIHDASLGARSNETSGRAIIARQEEGDTANFHFQDNLTTSITHEFRMTVALMRFIYDRPGRIAQIIGEEGEEKSVTLNQLHQVNGEEKIFDLRTGRYDVAVTVGPSFATKRQMQGELLMQLTKAYPELMQLCGDLLVKALDIPGSREIAERLKKMLPAPLQEQDGEEQPIPPQAQQKLAQMTQMIEALTQQLDQASDEIKANQPAIDSKERIELAKLEFQREELQANMNLEMAKLGSAEAIVELREDLARIRHQMELEAAEAQQASDQQHAAEQQAAAAAAAQTAPEAG